MALRKTGRFLLHPEVAGGWGPRTVVTNRPEIESGAERIPRVAHLEYTFDGWLGDELLESFPCFIVTAKLAESLRRAEITGAAFEHVDVSASETFEEMQPERALPGFVRLVPTGRAQTDGTTIVRSPSHDLALNQRAELVVSRAALEVLRRHKLDHCEVVELSPTQRSG